MHHAEVAEVDATQARGELQKAGGARGNQHVGIIPTKNNGKPSLSEAGLNRKATHDACKIRDALKERPDAAQARG